MQKLLVIQPSFYIWKNANHVLLTDCTIKKLKRIQRQLTRFYQLLSVLFLLAACGDSTPEFTPLTSTSTILAFGDSLTYGTGTSSENLSYPSVLNRLTGIKIINAGIPGEISAQGLTRLAKLLNKYKPDLVILCHGGNDLLQKRDPQETLDNIRSMVSLSRDSGAEILLIGVPQPGLFLKSAAIYQQIAQEEGVLLEDKLLKSIISKRELKSDAVHPNANGYHQLAEGIANLLLQKKAITRLYPVN